MDSLMSLFADPPKKRFEKRVCSNCGAEFDAVIYILKDRELDANRLCKACEKAKQDQEALAAANEELTKVSNEKRAYWKKIYGVSGQFQDKTFDNFNSKLQPIAYQAVKNLNGKSLVLFSPEIYGVGKTHLVAALANHLINTKAPAVLDSTLRVRTGTCPVHFITESLLLARIRDTFNEREDRGPVKETEETVYRFINSFPLLIIDDTGKVRPRDLSFLQSVYFRIIDQRYTEKKQLIITTNLDAAGLTNHIGGACMDRLYEMAGQSGFVYLKGQSYRQIGGK